ncbi:UPF0182 protein Cgl0786/cg0896 [Dietzia sp. NCCP-2495]|uniref:UPF0182 family protein n=1 Tax=Dietzia sp. NCCP-2495 TaxID=2934675 RepID=UPI0022313F0F|nr:UPF0182 family protein [Dietzia sp. NCCP-2495]GLB62580.1 UPF0182 protein Cgl0786/cg0896 [Dietzia sp. NCCP-2495]
MSVRPPGTPPGRPVAISRRGRAVAVAVVVLIILIQVLPRLNSAYTDWLWFRSVDASSVFRTEVLTRIGLFLVVGLLVGLAVTTGLLLAYRYRPVFLAHGGMPDALARYRAAMGTSTAKTVAWIPVVLGLLAGAIAQTGWKTVLAFFNSTDFGRTDPQFGLDISFYAFELPMWRAIVTWVMVAVVLAFFANLITHYIVGGVRPGAREGALTRAARIQLVILAGVFVLAKAAAYWLDRYELLFRENSTFTGASYTDVNAVMPAKIFMFSVAIVCAIAFFSAIVIKDLRIPALATVLLLFSALVVGSAWPMAVEQFSVKPNRAEKEREYIARNIEATRAAYDIGDDKVTYEENWGAANPDPAEAASDITTLSNIRVLDPNVLAPTFTQQQQLRNFYGFPETLSIDRYTVEGEKRDFLVAARELNPSALQANQRDWINRHTVYTHGNGFVAAPANRVNEIADDAGSDRGGLPNYQVSDLEAISSDQEMMIPVTQPRIYFGELIAQSDPDYAIVGDNGDGPREYDTDTEQYTYTGAGGVPVGGWINRTAYALKFAERNILLSGIIGDESKIIYDRDPRDRVQKVAPWLTTDTNTYPAVIDGRIKWIVDGYTTLKSYPYAESSSLEAMTSDSLNAAGGRVLPDEEVSYIRNSVKATVDAYDGTVNLYEFDETDPVLQTWSKALPDIVQPKSEIPEELQEHFRYPEDLFKVQRELLAKYQVNDPGQFFTNDAFWSVPSDPTVTSSIQNPQTPPAGGPLGGQNTGAPGTPGAQPAEREGPSQPPYYVLAKDPTDPESDEPSFQLISAFRGYEREFLAAHMSASSDPDSYGEIVVRVQRPTEPLAQGPNQAQDIMIASPAIAQDRRLWGETAEITEGNLLALPLAGDSVLYVEPIYTQRKDQDSAFPRLLRVMVTYDRAVGYAPTLYEALKQVGIEADPDEVRIDETGAAEAEAEAEDGPSSSSTEEGTASRPSTPPSTGGGDATDQAAAVRELNAALSAVRSAQNGGDLADLGSALDDLQKAVDAYQALGNGN